jgi:hypothetical protein
MGLFLDVVFVIRFNTTRHMTQLIVRYKCILNVILHSRQSASQHYLVELLLSSVHPLHVATLTHPTQDFLVFENEDLR